MEPVLDGVELGRVGGQIEHVDAVLFGQIDGLLFVVDCAVVHYDPFFLRLLLLLTILAYLLE